MMIAAATRARRKLSIALDCSPATAQIYQPPYVEVFGGLTYAARGPKAESGVCASSRVGMDDADGCEEGMPQRWRNGIETAGKIQKLAVSHRKCRETKNRWLQTQSVDESCERCPLIARQGSLRIAGWRRLGRAGVQIRGPPLIIPGFQARQ